MLYMRKFPGNWVEHLPMWWAVDSHNVFDWETDQYITMYAILESYDGGHNWITNSSCEDLASAIAFIDAWFDSVKVGA